MLLEEALGQQNHVSIMSEKCLIIQQIFIKHILHARYFLRHLGWNGDPIHEEWNQTPKCMSSR